MITWFPNEANAVIGIKEDRSIIWTVHGAAYFLPLLKKYGKKLADIETYAQFAIHNAIDTDNVVARIESELRSEITNAPNSREGLESAWLHSIIVGDSPAKIAAHQQKCERRNALSVAK